MADQKKLVGIFKSKNKNGLPVYTLYLEEPFGDYYDTPEEGRSCEGVKTDSLYAGDYDCSKLPLNASIEVFFEKAVVYNGKPYQKVAFINVIE